MVKTAAVLCRLATPNYVPVTIINAGYAPVTLRKNQTIGTLSEVPQQQSFPIMFVQSPQQIHVPPELDYIETLPPAGKQPKQQLNPDLEDSILSENAKKYLTRLIHRYSDVFVGTDGKIGQYTGPIQHEIELINPKDIPRKRPYRVPLPLRSEIERQLKQLLDQKIIEKSSSPFASPIVMVKKKDGTYRLCVDYRQLNQNTVKRVQLLPNIQEILDLTAGHKYFSTLDCSQAFHQVTLAPGSVEKTAFITHMGLFQYLRMPFGLTAAPATMQRIMDHLKGELTAKIFIYLDDLCVSSTDENDHIRDLEEVFSALRSKGLKLSLKKCFFGKNEVKYLGFLLSEKGIRPDPKNVETVAKFQIPKTLTELRSFIGAVSYFRRFIEGFATIMAPLYELTKQGDSIPSRWTESQDKAFKAVIEALKKAPTLAPPRQDRPYIIETDASAWGLAATLLQKNDHGFPRPIAYASRKLNKFEAKYPAVETEALAIVFGLKEFRPYIEGHIPTLIRTDNSALTSLLKRKDLQGRLAKYQLAIQQYNILIEHRSGKSNSFADYVSRYQPVSFVNIFYLDQNTVKNAQQTDPTCIEIANAINNKIFPELTKGRLKLFKLKLKNFRFIDDVLHHYKKGISRIYIPKELRTKILTDFHDDHLQGAHQGLQKSIANLKKRVFWDGMVRDMKQYISSCPQCQINKVNPGDKTLAKTIPFQPALFPFHRVHIDIKGPLPQTENGNRYILVSIDAHTKYVMVSPMPNQETKTVINAFMESVITKFGIMELLYSDNGSQFTDQLFVQLGKHYGFKHQYSPVNTPHLNGQVERVNRTLAVMLKTAAEDYSTHWDLHLSKMVFVYNTSPHATTKETPFFLMHGFDPLLPSDLLLRTFSQRRTTYGETDVAMQHIMAMNNAYEQAALQTHRTDDQNDDSAPIPSAPSSQKTITKNDLILIIDPAKKSKFQPTWIGPFRVMESGRSIIKARLLSDPRKITTTHVNKCKLYFTRDSSPILGQESSI
uniref:RNA-directed DNA polymerase n=1 Tax=Bursaphelenchus xylophilus TaxID=6326 RepID=A0A1I7RZG3_BURXY